MAGHFDAFHCVALAHGRPLRRVPLRCTCPWQVPYLIPTYNYQKTFSASNALSALSLAGLYILVCHGLRMLGDGDDRDFFFVRPIEPENSIGGWGFILSIGLEDFLSVWPCESAVFMSVQTRMSWIGFKVTEGLSNGLEAFEETRISSKQFEIRFGL